MANKRTEIAGDQHPKKVEAKGGALLKAETVAPIDPKLQEKQDITRETREKLRILKEEIQGVQADIEISGKVDVQKREARGEIHVEAVGENRFEVSSYGLSTTFRIDGSKAIFSALGHEFEIDGKSKNSYKSILKLANRINYTLYYATLSKANQSIGAPFYNEAGNLFIRGNSSTAFLNKFLVFDSLKNFSSHTMDGHVGDAMPGGEQGLHYLNARLNNITKAAKQNAPKFVPQKLDLQAPKASPRDYVDTRRETLNEAGKKQFDKITEEWGISYTEIENKWSEDYAVIQNKWQTEYTDINTKYDQLEKNPGKTDTRFSIEKAKKAELGGIWRKKTESEKTIWKEKTSQEKSMWDLRESKIVGLLSQEKYTKR